MRAAPCPETPAFCLDPAIVGVWQEITRTNYADAYIPRFKGIEIDNTGGVRGVGLDYRTGTIASIVPPRNLQEVAYACTGQFVSKQWSLGEIYSECGTYSTENNRLLFTYPRLGQNRTFVRTAIGKQFAPTTSIKLSLEIDAKTLALENVAYHWPTWATYRKDTHQHFSLTVETSGIALYIFLHEFSGPGRYHFRQTKDAVIWLDDHRGSGDAYWGFEKVDSTSPENFIEITRLDLNEKRAVGRLETILTNEPSKISLSRKVSATFDVPLIVLPSSRSDAP